MFFGCFEEAGSLEVPLAFASTIVTYAAYRATDIVSVLSDSTAYGMCTDAHRLQPRHSNQLDKLGWRGT